MQDATHGAWVQEASLPHGILDSLCDLNLHFLNLMHCGVGYWRVPVADLDATQFEAVARCPYALFDLNFDDATHWQLRLQGNSQSQVADDALADPRSVEFTRLAIFFAWHAVRVHGVPSQLTLGLTPAGALAFRRAGLQRLPALAAPASLQLAPRWQDSHAFWAALFKAGASRDPSRLQRVQLFGVQLAAAVNLGRAAPA